MTDEKADKRLFIGGLVETITKDDVIKRFNKFGDVGAVEIKIKDDAIAGGKKTFAYVDMKISETNFSKCMKIYNNSKWRGKELTIQVAKENFMKRLAVERQGNEDENKPKKKRSKREDHDTIRNMVVKETKPGAAVKNMENWVVGKDGQILPVVNIRRKDDKKVITVDPSVYLHNNKKMGDETNMDPLDTSIDHLTWKLDERKGKHMQDIARDSKWKLPKKPKSSHGNTVNFGKYCEGSNAKVVKKNSVKSKKTSGLTSAVGTIDFGSDSEDSDCIPNNSRTTANDGNSEDTDAMISKQNHVQSKVKSQTKIKSERSRAERNHQQDCSDSDDQLSDQTQPMSHKKSSKKVTKSTSKSDSSTSYSGDSVESGESEAAVDLTSIPKWLESDSDDEDVEMVESIMQNTGKEAGDASKNAESRTHAPKHSQESSSDESSEYSESSQYSQSSESSESETMVVSNDVLPNNISPDLSVKSSTCTLLSKKTVSQKRNLDSNDQKSAKIPKKSNDSKRNLANFSLKHDNRFDEYSNGFQDSVQHLAQSDDDDLDIFDMIDAGKTDKLFRDAQNCDNNKKNKNLATKAAKQAAVPLKLPKSVHCDKTIEELKTESKKKVKKAGKDGKTLCTAERQDLANQKRLETLKLRQKEVLMQKSAVKLALAAVDSKDVVNKRKVFDSDEDIEVAPPAGPKLSKIESSTDPETSASDSGVETKAAIQPKKAKSTKLFESDCDSSSSDSNSSDDELNDKLDDEDEERFRIRPQFAGETGGKLLQLQSRFGNDSRFKIDARFKEGSSDSESHSEPDQQTETVLSEKDRALEILKSVIGNKTPLKKQETKTFKDINTLQYDPTQAKHKQFEIPEKEKDKVETKSKKKSKVVEEVVPVPEVSSEKFYDVSTSLKDLFTNTDKNEEKGDQPFSLLSSFGTSEPADKNEGITMEAPSAAMSKSVFPWQHTSGREVSEEELDPEDDGDKQSAVGDKKVSPAPRFKAETFFLHLDDPMIQESLQFFICPEDNEEVRAKWLEERQDLVDDYKLKRKRRLRGVKSTQRLLKNKKGVPKWKQHILRKKNF